MKKILLFGAAAAALGYFLAPKLVSNSIAARAYNFGANGFKP